MLDRAAELKDLRERLDFLQKVDTQESFDECQRLHNLKNAPWIHGQYSDLVYEPYLFREYPKMLYTVDYEAACLEHDQALMLPGRGSNEQERDHAIVAALRRKTDATCKVGSEAEEAAKATRGWFTSPAAAVAATKAVDAERYLQQAHREHDDRNMGDLAKQEMRAHDDAAGDFTPEIPRTPIRRKPGRKAKQVHA